MNTQSPLIPQGSFLEQRNKGRARVKIAVFVVLAIHGIGLLALLMQGCKKEPDAGTAAGSDLTNANTAPTFATPSSNALPPLSNQPVTAAVAPTTPEVTPTALAPVAIDYKVVSGDTFSGIAKKFHTTTRAITDANPGIEPTKLQIGQTLHIPPPPPPGAMAGTSGNGASTADLASGEQIYTVKSGDTLLGIAADKHVSVKALRSANSLTTDRIKVGQKLKIPAKTTSVATNGNGALAPPPASGGATPPPQ